MEGVITVYLAAVLPLILSLVAASLKSAVSGMESAYAKRLLDVAMESAQGMFYGPLYQEYGVFSMWNPEYSDNMKEAVEKELNVTIDTALETSGGYSSFGMKKVKTDVTGLTGMLEYNGEPMRSQIISAAKYNAVEAFADCLLEKCSLLEGESKASTILEEKTELEEEFAAIDEKLLKLMTTTDGIRFRKGAVETDRDGNINTETCFVKVFQTGETTPEKVGINNERLYGALAARYRNPVEMSASLALAGSNYMTLRRQYDDLETRRENLETAILEAEDELSALGSTPEDEKAAEEIYERISNIEESIALTDEAMFELEPDIYRAEDETIRCSQEMDMYLSMTHVRTNEAVQIINDISRIGSSLKDRVVEFGELLSEASATLSSETLSMLSDSYEDMERYAGLLSEDGKTETGYNLEIMEVTLKHNQTVYDELIMYSIPFLPNEFTEEAETAWVNAVNERAEIFLQLSYEGLVFDYSDIQFEKKENSLFDSFEDLFTSGFYALLIPDYDNISNKSIMDRNLPSEWTGTTVHTKTENLTDGIADKTGSELLSGATESAEITGLTDMLCTAGDTVLNNILYLMYVSEHFGTYVSEEKRKDRPTEYEMEYIICGNEDDDENAEDVAFRILMLRTLVNSVYIMLDSEKKNEAEAFAVSVVGFVGLPFLISIVKYVTLFIWALEQSAVETMALFLGKQVVIIPTKETFSVTFPELLMLTPDHIRNKAENLKSGSMYMGYEEYLYIFLLLESRENQNYRVMDLMQSHIRYEYDTDFYIYQSMYGFDASLELSGKSGLLKVNSAICYN